MSGRRVTRASTATAGQLVREPDVQQPDEAVEDSAPVKPQHQAHPRQKGKRAATTTAQGPVRKKKATSKPVAPVKGGWILPHGMGIAVENIGDKAADLTTNDNINVETETAKPSTVGLLDVPVINDDIVATANDIPVDSSKAKQSTKKTVLNPISTGITRRQTRSSTAASKELTSTAQASLPPKPSSKDGLAASIERSDTAITEHEELAEQLVETPSLRRAVTRQGRKAHRTTEDAKATVGETPKPVVALIDQKVKVKRGLSNKYGLTRGSTPYPHRHAIPTKDQSEEVHRLLTEMHGEVKQPTKAPAPSLDKAGCGEVPSVLDALLRTLISGNTLMANADAAVKRLAETYGILTEGVGAGSINWNAVRLSSLEKLINVIRPAGCPKLKGGHIKAILDMVYEEQKARAQAHLENKPVPGGQNEDEGQKALEIEKVIEHYLSLDHMHAMTADEAITEFVRYPGIGVKTAACVVLFCLRIPCFAVDTHVHKFCVWLGWVPEKANELDTFNHGEFTVPDHLKYGLHQLFIRHGQQCFKCRKNTKPGTKAWENAPECPLEHLLDRSKGNFGRGDKEDDEEEMDDDNESVVAKKASKKKPAKPQRTKKKADTGTEDDETDAGPEKKTPNPPKRVTKRQGIKKEVNEEHDASGEDLETKPAVPVAPKQPGKMNGKRATAGKAVLKKTASKKVAEAVATGREVTVADEQDAADKNYKFVNSTVQEQKARSKIKLETGR
ncbi:hypothetical protein DL546_001534 [Coniochaeta pulveracea]|uniref:HhH-GPD domain-containing protein n=1 Tax=Coniochaeta pulveracea TaxID=177199 RepID=A0A420YC44_9PEZI|nr:hypothetical protein DL546_001534 [Coniochaeta pulveracea]